jgi:ferredoxin-NADP reductase
MNDPHIWWYVTRSSAILAWVLMTLSVVWGVVLSTRIFRKVDDPGWLQDLHRYFGGLSLVMVGVHIVSLMLDGWLHFTPLQALVPFQASYRTIPVALGIGAFYLLVIVYGSSLFRNRLRPRFWKFLHYFNYGSVVLIGFHAGLTGTDAGQWWYFAVSIVILSLTAIAVIVRLVMSQRTTSTPPAIEPPGTASDITTMVVAAARDIADGVRAVRLVPLGGGELPPWHPGSHLTLELPSGDTRQYSLCGDPAERHHYDISVLRELRSRGGSEWIHRSLHPGMTVRVWAPRNHFPLLPAPEYLFIAGGIGITPLRAMIESLPARRAWRLVYLGRSRATMAYLPDLLEQYPGQVFVYARDEHPLRLDVLEIVQRLAVDGVEVYCCGPESLISDVEAASPPHRFHAEHFEPVTRPAMIAQPLRLSLARSGLELTVPEDRSVLEVLEENRVPVLASCRRGVCGSCELRVIDGMPEHRDSVLGDAEKQELGIMFPCVSRAHTGHLVLDV